MIFEWKYDFVHFFSKLNVITWISSVIKLFYLL